MTTPFALLAAAVALVSVAACGSLRTYDNNTVSPEERDTADVGMAPYASFGNSAGSPAGANAAAASSGAVPRGPAASNYNGPNLPPDPSLRPTG